MVAGERQQTVDRTNGEDQDVVRVAAIADVHCTVMARGKLHPLFAQMAKAADVLALCGDLTQGGTVEEARVLVHELGSIVEKRTVVAVFGNHDVEAGQEQELRRVLGDAGIHLLDGTAHEAKGVGFAGVKGFGGGFHGRILVHYGEGLVKQFVDYAKDEARKLDEALDSLNTPQKIALLHYAPIRETVQNESPEIFPFLGSSHLEKPLNKHRVTAALHGHAHHGSLEGHTITGVPVYNVTEWLMRQQHPDRPFKLLRVAIPAAAEAPAGQKV